MKTILQIINRDFEELLGQIHNNAEIGVDIDEEGRASEYIDGFDSLILAAAEQASVAYIEENGIDMSDTELSTLMDRAYSIISKRVDANSVLSEIQESNITNREQYAASCR